MRASRGPDGHYLPTLDGWRAVSIAVVVLCHDSVHRLGPLSTQWIYDHGHNGVDVFFAISGLLICSRLMSEEEHKGSIRVGEFYLRRAFRILPPAIFYLAMLVVLRVTIGLPVGYPEIGSALLFLRNYTSSFQHLQAIYPAYTSHFWSLAVEEHFYLLLPALLVFCPRRWRVAALFSLAAAVALHRAWHDPAAQSQFHTDVRLDALLVPAGLAILLRGGEARARLIPWLRFWPAVAVLLLGVISLDRASRLEPLALAWLMPMVVLGTMLRPRSWFARFLELAPLRYLGRLSYSLYLWQQLFFVSHYGSESAHIAWLQRWPMCLLMTLAAAMFSYYLVERPFLRAGRWVIARRSAPADERQDERRDERQDERRERSIAIGDAS
jgi:peptidoglycan/LPS O-acetylase OafA/YrhL